MSGTLASDSEATKATGDAHVASNSGSSKTVSGTSTTTEDEGAVVGEAVMVGMVIVALSKP